MPPRATGFQLDPAAVMKPLRSAGNNDGTIFRSWRCPPPLRSGRAPRAAAVRRSGRRGRRRDAFPLISNVRSPGNGLSLRTPLSDTCRPLDRGDEGLKRCRREFAPFAHQLRFARGEFLLVVILRLCHVDRASPQGLVAAEATDSDHVAHFRAQPELIGRPPINQHRIADQQISGGSPPPGDRAGANEIEAKIGRGCVTTRGGMTSQPAVVARGMVPSVYGVEGGAAGEVRRTIRAGR